MQKQKPPDNGQPKTSSAFLTVLAKYLAAFAEHWGKEVTPANALTYEHGLADLTPDELELACSRALRTCRYMPVVADIRQAVEQDRQLAISAACDAEWSELLDKIDGWDEYYTAKYGRPVWGSAGAPALSEHGKQAVKLCGGYTAIRETKPAHRALLKKQFAEAYGRQVELESRGMLTDGQAKKLLGKVEEKTRQLRSGTPETDEQVPMPANVKRGMRKVGL